MHKFRPIKPHSLASNTSLPSSSSSSPPSRFGFPTHKYINAGILLSAFVLFFILRGCIDRTSLSIKNLSASAITVKEQMAPESKINLLNAVEDLYDGVTVDMKETMDPKTFIPLLRASMSKWKQQGKKGVWIKLPIALANLVEPVVQEGFKYHHAEADYLMLVYWIPHHIPNTLPDNASHRVGIGAFVINNIKEVLVVNEKNGGFRGTGVWKLPTGVVNEGEDISKAAIREVFEETGIETEFVEVLTFRQSHQSFFSKSDLFFVCMLRPRSFDIQKQDSEIEAAKWMPMKEYVEQPYNKKHKLFKYVAEICQTKSYGGYIGFSATPTSIASGKETYLYSSNRNLSNL
ncbi:nudix hydrolase 7-like [Mercurialis annua]|uniref:nudix hydrolase 7-like n=1 Tax=Mercurialis annua TaxID=3986 RepID=UPI0024AD6F3B|nr:nudix hydrolase 7-like [Mercurialis annua]